MILQSLVQYYEALCREGKIAEQGWTEVNVSFALWIDEEGKLERITSLRRPDPNNSKKMLPQRMIVPAQVDRTSKIVPRFLCDNASYFLGMDNKDEKRARECFKASQQYHHKMLDILSDKEKAVKALLLFFDSWDPTVDGVCMDFEQYKADIKNKANFVFCFNGIYLHEIGTVRNIWNKENNHYNNVEKRICLVTGRKDETQRVHQSIKGIKTQKQSEHKKGAPPSLVSFNQLAFCSYGWKQGMNAPIGRYAVMAYGTALNYLMDELSDRQYLGDTAVLCYAANGNAAYKFAFDVFFMGEESTYSERELRDMVLNLCEGKSVIFEESKLDPEMNFNILGITPNVGRLSIRFFHSGSFGRFIQNIRSHQKRMEMEKGEKNPNNLSLWMILHETYKEEKGDGKKKDTDELDEKFPSKLAGEMLRSILLDERYPTTLINALDLRIRSDHKINATRASVIKAYYMKNKNQFVPKEVLTVSLNKETNNMPYNLGRLFAVLEKIQKEVNKKKQKETSKEGEDMSQTKNSSADVTIRDKFFGSASATPASVFPHLINLTQYHLRKLNTGTRVYYEKLIGEIMETISTNEFPKILSMPERGAFQIGYYHQVQELYKKGSQVEEGGAENE